LLNLSQKKNVQVIYHLNLVGWKVYNTSIYLLISWVAPYHKSSGAVLS
jgi:hypothetical protein